MLSVHRMSRCSDWLWQVVGWGDSVEELAGGLAEFAVEGTRVTVISPDQPQGLPKGPLRGCQFRHIEGSPTSFQSFHQAGVANCDSLLLGQTNTALRLSASTSQSADVQVALYHIAWDSLQNRASRVTSLLRNCILHGSASCTCSEIIWCFRAWYHTC